MDGRPERDLPSAVLLMGPTACGKSALALALAADFPIEIVSVDSAQVFRGMDIGTAKPSLAEREAVPHHLIDLIEPTDRYSAAQFRHDALACMHAIARRGRLPLLVGGTMLYFRALRHGLSDLPGADPDVREAIDRDARTRGWPAMHAKLAALDPAAAARIRAHDAQRIQRALEVVHITGRAMSGQIGPRAGAPPFRLLPIALVASDRTALHRRIAERFEAMLRAGLIEEVESLQSRYHLDASLPSMRCVGYRQVWRCLAGDLARAELRERGIYATRQLAKRQLTWLRADAEAAVFDALAPACAASVRAAITRWLDAA